MIIPTRENSAVLFLDLQQEIVKNSQTLPLQRLQKTTGALAKLVALHKLPFFLSAVAQGNAFLDCVLQPLDNPQTRLRTQTTAFADQELVTALKKTGRKVVILAGVASEIVVQRTALDALHAGYEVHIAVDACGGLSARTEEAAWRRVIAAGGTTTSCVTFAAELTGDFTTELGQKTLGIMYELLSG